jgi:hypothetical protein
MTSLVPSFTIMGKRKHKIWTPGVMRPEFARHMMPQIRRLIALWEIPGLGVKRYARLCGLEPGEFLYLNRALRTEYAFTQFQAVRFCLDHGLPASAWVELPAIPPQKRSTIVDTKMSVVCPVCSMTVHGLPCVRCKSGPDDDPESLLARECEDDPILGMPEPTDAQPGSPEKFRVLCERVSRGQHLWHPDDNNRPIANGLWALEDREAAIF